MTESGSMTDAQLADLWLNSDALHTQPTKPGVGTDMGLNERYRAAAGVYVRIGACMENTYFVIVYLVREGLQDLDQAVFTQPVIADSDIDVPTMAYCTPLGAAPMPKDMSELDLSTWKPVHEDPSIVQALEAKKAAGNG